MKVLITYKIPDVAEKLCRANGITTFVNKSKLPLSKNGFIKEGKDADALITLLSDKIDKEIIDFLPKCKIIANYAVGFNNIDVQYAKSKGIIVTNTPDILTDATADLTMALILTTSRRVLEGDKLIRLNKFKGWKPDLLLGMDLKGKILGIIGAGRIGCATALRAKAFGMKIIYFNRTKKPEFEKEASAQKVSLNKLLKSSDIISIHLPLTKETYHLLNFENLRLLKKTAIIINTARGEIIDERALIRLLKNKEIFSAGLDVYENEPVINKELLTMENIVLLPHIGSAGKDTRDKMARLAAKNVINVLSGKKAITPV